MFLPPSRRSKADAILPEPPTPTNPDNAIDRIVAAAKAHAGELVIVATGPLTDRKSVV